MSKLEPCPNPDCQDGEVEVIDNGPWQMMSLDQWLSTYPSSRSETCEECDGKGYVEKPEIPAECHSDDHRVEIDFDAVDWFRQASAEEIADLADCEWGGDMPADEVARFFSGNVTGRLFKYLDFDPVMSFSDDKVGFECHVDDEAAIAWLKANRPECVPADYRDDDPEEPEYAFGGLNDWGGNGDA